MQNTVNTKRDASSYESRGYKREITDGNALYDAYLKAKRGSDWKPQVQKYEMTWLLELAREQSELRTRAYEFKPTSTFTLHERGKVRRITGEQLPDRIVKHALCDEALNPQILPHLIYDNGASQKGKGIDFARRRLLAHLRRYYAKHRSNEGYILLIDFSKYYDNIRHDELLRLFRPYVADPCAWWLLEKTIDRSKVDVSYMSSGEYAKCMGVVFDVKEYAKLDKKLLTGERYMHKHLNIGDQVAQTAGIAYPMELDNYIKIVCGEKYYGRYMDDSYLIHEDRNHLIAMRDAIEREAAKLGITVNRKKTRICKLSDRWRFLQVQYSLTETGRVMQKINPKRVTAMRRKLKKLAPKLSDEEFSALYKSWFCGNYKLMSRKQRENMDALYTNLLEEKHGQNLHDNPC